MTPCSILLSYFTVWIQAYLPWIDKRPKNKDICETNSIFTILSSHEMHKISTQWERAECSQFRVLSLQIFVNNQLEAQFFFM